MIPLIIRGALILVNTLAAADFAKAAVDYLRQKDDKDKNLQDIADEGKVPLDDVKQARAAVFYEQLERGGQSPDEFWNNAPQDVKDTLAFSPDSLRRSMNRTNFLGIASALTFVGAAVALGIAGFRGIPLAASYLARVADALKAGKTAEEVSNILTEFRVASLSKVGAPGLVAGVLAAAGFSAGTWANNINDVDLWGRINLQNALDDARRGQKFLGPTGNVTSNAAGTGAFQNTATLTKTAKPKMFLGTVFAGRVADVPDFVRKPDDQITSDQDLRDDIQTNLTLWIASISDRLNYEIQVKFEPFDEYNVKKPGTWLTLSLYYSGKGGKRIFIDEILLGPFEPKIYYPTSTVSEAIRKAVDSAVQPEILSPQLTADGSLVVITKEGASVSIFDRNSARLVGTPTTPAAPAAPPVSNFDPTLSLEQNIERGIIREGDFVPGYGILRPDGTFDSSGVAARGNAPQPASLASGGSLTFTPALTPTAEQLAARTQPQTVVYDFPGSGLFRARGDFGTQIYRRVGSKVYGASMLNTELVPNLASVVGAGNQATIAINTLQSRFGLNWYSLPEVLIGDLANDSTLQIARVAGPDGGPPNMVFSVASVAELLALGPLVSATVTSQVFTNS